MKECRLIDCSYYDTKMTGNCSRGNDGSLAEWCCNHGYCYKSPKKDNALDDNKCDTCIEHRRRVAAEELYELHTEYYLKINDYDDEQLSDMEFKISKAFKKWQSIIKEAGE